MDGLFWPRIRPRVAVIGAGIAGLSAAWLLRDTCEVTLFEAEARLGGHADTQEVEVAGERVAVDTGFIVYNEVNYPNLVGLFDALGVTSEASDMSFGVSIGDGRLEYAGGAWPQLFAQKRNLLRPRFLAMLRDVVRFYREAPRQLADADEALTLGAFLARERYGPAFVHDHLLPMGAAIWSASVDGMRDFPARAFVRFFENHGLLRLSGRPRWRTVSGGSRRYVARIAADLDGCVSTGRAVLAVARDKTGATVHLEDGATQRFDRVVLAVHGDAALRMLDRPSAAERAVLSQVRYQDNAMILHTDETLMPRRRGVWSSWNYLARGPADHRREVAVTYWMNRLQNLRTAQPLFVSLNPFRAPRPGTVLVEKTYRHPQYDPAMLRAQAQLPSIQGRDRVWFCGAWCGYGFHEDGIASAIAVAQDFGVAAPWQGTPALAEVA
ncbi:NAD(P)/FAD-dependent oxidoreductase [Elioraea tepidiphila]|uniref:NAD(P)/FAD-dependent oxidoreductase n=1 Tax=Elioraea tepidiphila TaxID=457934 RepID=UPI0003633644|nr:FAD-dependent oxidoreductase [Elioraea tepidiphila]